MRYEARWNTMDKNAPQMTSAGSPLEAVQCLMSISSGAGTAFVFQVDEDGKETLVKLYEIK